MLLLCANSNIGQDVLLREGAVLVTLAVKLQRRLHPDLGLQLQLISSAQWDHTEVLSLQMARVTDS